MRAFLRLLVLLGVLLSATAVAPVAALADDDSGTPVTSGSTAGDTTGDTTEGTNAVDDPSGSEVPAGPGDPMSTGATTSQDPTVTGGLGAAETLEPSEDAPVLAPETRITAGPSSVTTYGSATIRYDANLPAAHFVCTLAKNGRAAVAVSCPVTAASTDATTTKGSRTLRGLTVGSYTFTAQAVVGVSPALVPDPTPASRTWRIGATMSPPDSYSPPSGAKFNNPTGALAAKRRNLTHVIRTINSMPGYRVASPAVCDPRVFPSTIRITLYSATDMNFARALVAASRRCVSVQILMNNHLGPLNTPAVAYMQRQLGASVRTASGVRRSYAHRCDNGCRGGGVLHSKIYLFHASIRPPRGPKITNTVMVGSSNMTSNAARVQWNDLYTVRGNATLYGQYLTMYNRMARDRDEKKTFQFTTGIFQSTFTPVTPRSTDPTVSALRSIHCVGARPGTGIGGRSVVYINMHAWFGVRGYAMAKQVRAMYDRGCYVKVLYSFMSRSVYKKLTKGTGARMSARRTIFSRHGVHATLYSHFKMIAASGYVGSNHSASVVWTGSNNFTNDGLHFDEVTMRIASRAALAQYRGQFSFITRTRSSGTYASFAEPVGGGRAVR